MKPHRLITIAAALMLSMAFCSCKVVGSLLAPLPGETVGNIINLDDPSNYAVGYISVCNCAVYYVQKDVKVPPQYNFAADYVVEVEKGYSIKKPADWD